MQTANRKPDGQLCRAGQKSLQISLTIYEADEWSKESHASVAGDNDSPQERDLADRVLISTQGQSWGPDPLTHEAKRSRISRSY